MRIRTHTGVKYFVALLALVAPCFSSAALPQFILYDAPFIGVPHIQGVPGSRPQTALKNGDTFTLQANVRSVFGDIPVVTADLSQLGFASATTVPAGAGGVPGHRIFNSADYYPSYHYNFGPLILGAGVPDGIVSIPLTATDVAGHLSTTTARIAIDNHPPTFSISNISFSAIPPRHGDVMYLSGSASGTGSSLTVHQVRETLWNAHGNPIFPAGSGINYAPSVLTAAIANSADGSFTNVPFTLVEASPGEIARATSIRITIDAYDGAGKFVSTSLTIPVPTSPPPDPCAHTACASNILFLPGIEASRLYRPAGASGEKKVWEPGLFDTLQDLYMSPAGRSVHDDVYTKTGDVLDEVPVTGANIYKSFIAKMNSLRDAQIINDWEAVPYDWRLSLEDIILNGTQSGNRISYLDATSTPYVIQELRRLAATSKTRKVTLIAHSNGGLVAKWLTNVLGPEASSIIDKMIFVAVPQAGTPAAIAADLHGYGQAFGGGLFVSEATARTFASTTPMAYHLLPSSKYFTQVDDPVVEFDASLPEWSTRYGEVVHSAERLRNFLTSSFGRVDAQAGDIDQPIVLSDPLLSQAESVHAVIDSWNPPLGVELIQIAGWGVPTTLSGITYKKKGSGVRPEANFTIDGDGTVVVPSALWTSTTTGVTNYWVNLRKYNSDNFTSAGFGLARFDHSRILEPKQLLDFIADTIAKVNKSLSDYVYLSTQPPPASEALLRYALHSPLTLSLYDELGRHTGVSTTTGRVEEQIPGTYYTQFGDVKYLFSDASHGAQIILNGYGEGTFTLHVDQFSGNTLTASTTFRDIPTTERTQVMLGVTSDVSTLSPMRIDKDGDGLVDAVIHPRINDAVTLDTTPPEISISFSTSTKSIVFTGHDDVSTTTITTQTLHPILKRNQKEPRGIATTTVTAMDASGNVTALVYTEKLPSPAQRDTLIPIALSYNGATTTLSASRISYKWRLQKEGVYKLFATYLQTESGRLESHFRSKKNRTVIMSKPADLDDLDSDEASDIRPTKHILPGMVIPYIETKNGNLIISH